jgi:serine/threonine protein kinase
MSDYQPNRVIPGTVYQVIRLLGQGGMGTVYEVEDTTVGKRYVLKTLHAQLRDRKELAARINKEARVLARLSHTNIVEVVTAGITGDDLRLPFFVMQKLNGHTLRAVLLAKGRLPFQTALSIAIDLLDALDHAHGIGVIHRDVKPENIFLHRTPTERHETKLLDFGVMRMLSGDQPQTGARFVGTLRYAPPEQLRGGPITPRTDLYATGLVLYEMISGSGPFDEETTDRGIASAHLEREPPPLSSRAPVPVEIERLVMSALAKDPEARPRDAFTFAAKLRECARAAAHTRSGEAISQHGTVETLLSAIEAPPSATNLDTAGMTPEVTHLRPTTLENAGPPVTDPGQTLRLDAVAKDQTEVDRGAATRTSAPLGDPLPGGGGSLDRPATTTGAISSHAAPSFAGRGRVVATLAVLSALGVGGGIAGLAFHARRRVESAPATAPKATSEAANPVRVDGAVPAPSLTESPPSPPSPAPEPSAVAIPPPPAAPASSVSAAAPSPSPSATPTPTAPRAHPRPKASPPDSKPRLPGPGF